MTEKEFQVKHELTDADIATIKSICKSFKGKITKIKRREAHVDRFDW